MDGQPRTAAERLRDWLDARPEVSQSALAARCNVPRQRISDAVRGGAVSATLRKVLERETGIEADAWDGGDAAPVSDQRPLVEEPLESTPEELRRTVSRLKRLASGTGLTHPQRATLEGKLVTALAALSRLEERQAIQDHPDAEPFLGDLTRAFFDVLPTVPTADTLRLRVIADTLDGAARASLYQLADVIEAQHQAFTGIVERFAARFEELQAKRAAAPRKAAA